MSDPVAHLSAALETAEEDSRRAHDRLIKAEEVARMGFLDWNFETNAVVCSKGVYSLFGIEPETPLTAEQLTNMVHPDDRERVDSNLDMAIQGIRDYDIDHRMVRPDGKVVWVQARADLERGEEGAPISLIGTVVDITERKLGEEELLINHEEVKRQYTELEQLYKNLPIGLCLVGRDFRYIRINKMLAEINGSPVDHHIGRTLRDIIPELAETQVEDFYHRVFETGEPITDIEVAGTTLADPDTERSWLVSYYPIESYDGKVAFVGTTVRDVTKRKKAEASLKASEARFRMIYENAPVMIDAYDSDRRCIMFNKECEKVFGWSAEEVYALDDPLALFYPDPEIRRQVVETVTSKPDKVFREWEQTKKDGSEAVCLWANFELPDGFVINLGYDITERRKSEEDMRELRSELLHTTRVLTMGELTGALAHELNHPLGSILNNANAAKRVLEREEPNLNEIQDIIADIISEDRRASNVIQRLRDLMRKTAVKLSSLAINDVIEDVIELIHSDFVIKNISLSTKLAKKLPEISGDRVQLQQVFLNLILNATDAMKESKEKNLQISTAKHGGEGVIVCVKDSGSGFDQKEKDELFEPFFTTKEEGMGMGLPIAQTIIKALHGEIWVENNEEGGASFFVTLPVYEKK
jgi:PAS domain S-box-containing protein